MADNRMTENDQANYRNFKDFLMTYNKMTEVCFSRCVGNLNYRNLTDEELHCTENCSNKLININHKLMATFMEIQGKKQQAMMMQAEEQEQAKLTQAQILLEAGKLKAEHMAGGATETETVSVSETPIQTPEVPSATVDSTSSLPTTQTATEDTVS